MSAVVPVRQYKLTCKKKTNKFNIESLDKKEKDELVKITSKYIFGLEILAEAEFYNQSEANAWKEEHPDIIGKNVANAVKNCVNNIYFCYIDGVFNTTRVKMPFVAYRKMNNNYMIQFQIVTIVLDSNNNIILNEGYY